MNVTETVTVKDIYNYIDSFAPFSSALEFDNVGILVGDQNAIISKVLCTLDITEDTVSEAVKTGVNLVISHHPVIFDPVKSVQNGSVVYSLCRNGISAICAHTNLDAAKGGVNDVLCSLLELVDVRIWEPENIGRIGKTDTTVEEMAERVLKRLKLNTVNYIDNGRRVKNVAVMGGSGGGDIDNAVNAGADTLITGEVKHSHYYKAKNAGLNLIVAGHFNTEFPVIPVLTNLLSNHFVDIDFQIHCEPPFKTLVADYISE